MASPSSFMLGIWDPQAPYNVEKILDTINNLVRVLELTLMLSLSPVPPPPTPPATVILPKVTTLGSGLDQVSPPRPGTNWANWSNAMGREMYLRRALDRLNFEYPSDDVL
jgi:hypothetical protein